MNSSRFPHLLIAILALSVILLPAGCKKNPKSQNKLQELSFTILPTKYAKGFSISRADSIYRIDILNPWRDCDTISSYLFSTDPSVKDVTLIPIVRIGVTSCTQLPYLDLLNQLPSICGVSDPKRIYNPKVRDLIENKQINDLGDPFRLDIEHVLSIHPDVLLVSGYNEQDKNNDRFARSGIVRMFINEWLEATPLARAEWIKVFGVLAGKPEIAYAKFDSIEQRYLQVQQKTVDSPSNMKILTGENFKGTWYMPSKQNWMTQILLDAGGKYEATNSDQSVGSIGFTLEQILSKYSNASIWFGVNVNSLQELKATESRYRFIKAFQNGEVFHYKKRSTASGGNDFWESAVVSPDQLLEDFMQAIHPTRYPNRESIYIERLKP